MEQFKKHWTLRMPTNLRQILLLSLFGFIFHSPLSSTSNTVSCAFADSVDDSRTNEFTNYHRIKPKLIIPETYQTSYRVHHRAKRSTAANLDDQKLNGHANHVTLELPLVVKDESSSTPSFHSHHSSAHGSQTKPQQVHVYTVDLQLNKDLIPDGHFVRVQENLQPVITKPDTSHLKSLHCHYHGKIRGIQNSWAALSTCTGLRGVVFDGNELHYLEPSRNSSSMTDGKNGSIDNWDTLHFRDSDRTRNLTCGHTHTDKTHFPFQLSVGEKQNHVHDSLDGEPKLRVKRGTASSSIHVPYNSNSKSRYVELVLVVDNKKFKELNSNVDEAVQRTKEIANIVNVLYAPLNIFIALVGVVVWNQVDEITLSPKGDETLANFLRYRRERLLKDHPNDNAQLLTAFEFEDGVVGKAMQGPICSYKYSGGVNSDFKSILGVVATTVAHELGHNFGLSHDTDTCECNGPNSKCIMSASSSSNRTAHWSSCSKDAIKYAFKHGMDYCLRNKPKSLFKGPVCGNGFTEPGEECDCGHVEHCSNPCCNANTCQLHSNSTCGSGECCDYSTCHPKQGGTVCRNAQSQCDLPEYCNGDAEFCPDDVFKQNGGDCETKNGMAQCYDGQCRTHTDQCKLLWGPTGTTSMDMCYQKNVNGSRYGHCGYNLGTDKYAKCAREDIKCGVLQCKHEEEKLQFGYEQVAILSTFFLNAGGTVHPCRSVSTDFGLTDVDPGLAPDGARCGDGKMCVSQKCVATSSIVTPFKCPDNCNGNGFCNSKGHCHCDEGFGGESCNSGGYGGSIDSGPIVNPYSSSSVFAKALYVTFLGFIPLIAVISFYLYYAGDNFKKLCKRGQAVTRIQTRSKPYQNGSGGGQRDPNSTAITTMPPNSTSSGSMNTAADDFFGQYKGFSLSPVRNGSAPNGDVRTHKAAASPAPVNGIIVQENSYCAKLSSPKAPAAPLQSQILLKNDKPSLKENFLQKGITRVSWAHPIAHTTPISPEGNNDDETANNSDTPLYENMQHLHTTVKISSNQPRSPQKVRPLSSPDALNDSKMFDPTIPHTITKKDTSNFFGGSTSALSRLASAFPFMRNSLMRNSSSTESTNNGSAPSNNASKGIQRQKSFNRDSVQISQPILQNSNQIESKMHNLVSIIPPGDTVDGPVSKAEPAHRYINLASGHRYTNVPLEESNSQSPSPVAKPASPKFLGKSVLAKPFSRNLVRLKPQTSEPTPQVQAEKVPRQSEKSASPPPPAPITKPTVVRAHSMSQPNRNSIGSNPNPNYNSLRRSRPSAPPPKPPEAASQPAAKPASTPPPTKFTAPSPPIFKQTSYKQASPPPVPKSSLMKYSIGGRFSSRNPAPLTLNTKSATNTNSCLAPIARIDDMNSPSSVCSSADIKPENIYDVIDEQNVEEKIETLSTGSSENGGGLMSEIISEISSRNRDSIYNSMDRRKLRREKHKKTELSEKKSISPTPNTPKSKIETDKVRRELSKGPAPAPNSSSSSPAPRITINPGFDRILKPASPKSSHRKATPPAYNMIPPISVPAANHTPIPAPPPTTELSPSAATAAKPTCAVNGIPKIASSPSYVAKINYFSNLGHGSKNDPLNNKLVSMKPISSLSQSLSPAPCSILSPPESYEKETIYAPGQLSTIRRSRMSNHKSYLNNVAGDVSSVNNNLQNSKPLVGGNSNSTGIYGKPVGIPKIPLSNTDGSVLNNSINNCVTNNGGTSGSDPPTNSSLISDKDDVAKAATIAGYKSFHPYLNRTLTFSTFRPSSGSSFKMSDSSSTTAPPPMNLNTTTSASGLSGPNALLCSVNSKTNSQNIFGIGVSN